MTPKEYLDRYTYLFYMSPTLGIYDLVNITSYGSGWGHTADDNRPTGYLCQQEYNGAFKPALQYGIDPTRHGAYGSVISFPDGSPLRETFGAEIFYRSGLIRAFLGKGTPDEIADALRVAIAVGRIGTERDRANHRPAQTTVQAYARAFMSLDCNGLVGNYYGINPETSIEAYANRTKRRRTAAEVQQGDCLVTVTGAGRFKHIALIDRFVAGAGANPTCTVDIVEWGQQGDETAHYSTAQRRIVQGPNTHFGVGFVSGDNFRYIFAPPANAQDEPRRWGWDGDETR